MTTELVELADRPGCGGRDARVIGGPGTAGGPQYWAGCDHCPWRTWGDTEAEAITAWNTRALASRAGGLDDTVRMDWLADRNNIIGNVQLPTVCVMNNLHDMRGAIDEAMRLDPEIAAAIAAAPEPGEVG